MKDWMLKNWKALQGLGFEKQAHAMGIATMTSDHCRGANHCVKQHCYNGGKYEREQAAPAAELSKVGAVEAFRRNWVECGSNSVVRVGCDMSLPGNGSPCRFLPQFSYAWDHDHSFEHQEG
jgi:hypothetical protein